MKEIEKLTTYELTLEHARLESACEQMPPGVILSSSKQKEKNTIKTLLRQRLYESLTSDILPVVPTVINTTTIKKKTPGKVREARQKEGGIIFRFDVISSLNVKVDSFKIEAATKDLALKEAEKMRRKYRGLVKFKIS